MSIFDKIFLEKFLKIRKLLQFHVGGRVDNSDHRIWSFEEQRTR